jgi:hypothetical protein
MLHRAEGRRVDRRAPVAPEIDQAGLPQLVQEE